jgi:hypothetical protein
MIREFFALFYENGGIVSGGVLKEKEYSVRLLELLVIRGGFEVGNAVEPRRPRRPRREPGYSDEAQALGISFEPFLRVLRELRG